MLETETIGPFLVHKLKGGVGGGAWPPGPPVTTPKQPIALIARFIEALLALE